MVLDLFGWKYPNTVSIAAQPTDWTDPADNESTDGGSGAAGIDTGLVRAAIWSREKDAGWSTMPTVDMSAAPNTLIHHGISFSKGAGEIWEPVVTAFAVDTTGNASLVDPSASQAIPLTVGDMIVAFWAMNGDAGTPTLPTAYSAPSITFGTVSGRFNVANTVGQDMRVCCDTFSVTAGTATSGIDSSITYSVAGNAALAGAVVYARLRASTPPAIGPPWRHPLRRRPVHLLRR